MNHADNNGAESEPPGILAGVKVIDFTTGLAGSAAALYLAEAGAEVVKITRPRNEAERDSVLFRVLDRGKRQVAAALSESGQRLALETLLAGADVLLHDLTPSQASAWSLDAELLAQRYATLVVGVIGAWPLGHAEADAPQRETLVLARLGLLDEQPGHHPGPVFVRMPFAGWIASWLCAVGVLARLLARDRDGRGGVARTSLAQAALVPMTMHWSSAEFPTPLFAKGLDKHIPVPLHQCADGRWIHVHYSPDAAPWMAQGLAALGEREVARLNAQFAPSHVAPNFGANQRIIAGRPAREWAEHFWAHDIAAQIAVPFGEIYGDRQALINGYVVAVHDEKLGLTWQPGPACTVQPAARVRASATGTRAAWRSAPAAGVAALAPTTTGTSRAPLEGVKVLDLGAYLAGPFACMLLADLGADVIKVEPPAGDAMRRLERAFAGIQRGKRGLALKLDAPGAQPVLAALTRWADVVHHNMRMPAARKLGIAPEQLRAGRPELVCTHVSAYGPLGERADWPGFDQLVQAACGWEVESGGEGNPPLWLRFGVGDYLAALASVFATLLALYQRNRSGRGQAVATSLLGAMLTTVGEAVARADGSITQIARLDGAQTGLSAAHRLYRCRDGWIAVAALECAEAAAFQHLAGADPELALVGQDSAPVLAALREAGVPCEAVRQDAGAAFLDSAEHGAAGLHVKYRHAVYGTLRQVGALWDFGDLPLSLTKPPPSLGEHSREVLDMLGFGAAEIDTLVAGGVSRMG